MQHACQGEEPLACVLCMCLLCMRGTIGIGEGRGQSRGTAGLVSQAPYFQIWRHRHLHRFYALLFRAAYAHRPMPSTHSGHNELSCRLAAPAELSRNPLDSCPSFENSRITRTTPSTFAGAVVYARMVRRSGTLMMTEVGTAL